MADWQTHPSLADGIAERCACRTLPNYAAVVRALPADQRGPFVCPCCPESPALSLCCTIFPCLIPQAALVGIWLGAHRVHRLRRLVAPPGAPADSYCKTCMMLDTKLLQMRHEVDYRLAHQLPTVIAAPATQKMLDADRT